MSRIDEIIAEANAAGYSVANLYQLMSHPAFIHARPQLTGEWQCNFRNGRDHYEFGRGDTMEEALEDAMRQARGKATLPRPHEPTPKQLSLGDLE